MMTKPTRRPRRLLIGVIVAIVLAIASPPSVGATNFGANQAAGGTPAHICDATPQSQCVANNQYHAVYVNVTGSYRTQILWAMSNYTSVAPPISMYEVYPPALDKDVEVLLITSQSVPALAWTQCMGPPGSSGMTYGGSDAAHTRWCRPQRLYYNTLYASSHFPTDAKKRYIACHELGHTIGLRHTNESSGTCMLKATIDPNYVPTNSTTSGHDRAHIDANY